MLPHSPPAARQPVLVLIADFENQAKEPVFTGSLEQALNIAIEGASFITVLAHEHAELAGQLVADRSSMSSRAGWSPPAVASTSS